jgi:hypothetical protein
VNVARTELRHPPQDSVQIHGVRIGALAVDL